jgi:P-type conjugative transfer protein TrbJ
MQNYKGDAGRWANMQNLLYHLANQVEQGQALAYQMQDIDRQYRSRFPGYVAPQNYQESYRNWSQTTHDTLLSTLASAGMQAEQFHQEQMTLNQLAGLSQTAQGRMQAMQVGNMLASQQIGQLQALRQLIVTQINAQNTYAAYQTQKEASVEASTDQWISGSQTAFPQYGKNPQSTKEGSSCR